MLSEKLRKIADHRRGQGRMYDLHYILLYSIMAALAGASSYRQIHTFIQTHLEKLNEAFGSSWKRAPAYTSIRYILQGIDTARLEKAFRSHARQIIGGKGGVSVAVDGKTLRGSFDGFHDRKAANVVGAFCHDRKIILGHLDTDANSNEIPAVRKLIKELGLEGRVFTVDAMHCQKNV